MPHFHNPKGHIDGWWRNRALDANGAPRALNLGLVSLAPGAVRFVDAKTVVRSGGAFDNAKAAGLVVGPFASQGEGESDPPAAKEESVLSAAVHAAVADALDTDTSPFTVTPVVEEPVEETVVEEATKADKKSSKKSRY